MMVNTDKIVHFLTFILTFVTGTLLAQGYEIQIKAPDFAGKEVILAEYFTNRMVPKDTAQISLTGEAVFTGDQPFDGGMYVVYFGASYFFDFLMDRDQVFSVSVDSTDLVQNTRFTGSADNELFYTYKQYLSDQRKLQQQYEAQLAAAGTQADSVSIQSKLEDLNAQMNTYVDALISENSDTFFSTFLEAMKEHRAPEKILKGTKRQQDSIRYVYYKDHYFDTFNPSD